MTTQTGTHHADDEAPSADKSVRFERAARLMVRTGKLLMVSGLMGLLVAAFLASPSNSERATGRDSSNVAGPHVPGPHLPGLCCASVVPRCTGTGCAEPESSPPRAREAQPVDPDVARRSEFATTCTAIGGLVTSFAGLLTAISGLVTLRRTRSVAAVPPARTGLRSPRPRARRTSTVRARPGRLSVPGA